jgi:hypothetical protein
VIRLAKSSPPKLGGALAGQLAAQFADVGKLLKRLITKHSQLLEISLNCSKPVGLLYNEVQAAEVAQQFMHEHKLRNQLNDKHKHLAAAKSSSPGEPPHARVNCASVPGTRARIARNTGHNFGSTTHSAAARSKPAT